MKRNAMQRSETRCNAVKRTIATMPADHPPWSLARGGEQAAPDRAGDLTLDINALVAA
jgi:hypothetical protein